MTPPNKAGKVKIYLLKFERRLLRANMRWGHIIETFLYSKNKYYLRGFHGAKTSHQLNDESLILNQNSLEIGISRRCSLLVPPAHLNMTIFSLNFLRDGRGD